MKVRGSSMSSRLRRLLIVVHSCPYQSCLTTTTRKGCATSRSAASDEHSLTLRLLDLQKRKLQNRAAQRNFRERKEQHVHTLEARVAEQDLELETLRAIIDRCVTSLVYFGPFHISVHLLTTIPLDLRPRTKRCEEAKTFHPAGLHQSRLLRPQR